MTRDNAYLWTDGRYFIQAAKQLEGTGVTLMKMGEEGVPTVEEFIKENLPMNGCLGCDGRTVHVAEGRDFGNSGTGKEADLSIRMIWQEKSGQTDRKCQKSLSIR